MFQNQINNQLAATQAASMGVAGFFGGNGLVGQQAYDQMRAMYPRDTPRPTTIGKMRSDVKDWLEDWDK